MAHSPDTLVHHASCRGDPATGRAGVSIRQTTSHQFRDTDDALALFSPTPLRRLAARDPGDLRLILVRGAGPAPTLTDPGAMAMLSGDLDRSVPLHTHVPGLRAVHRQAVSFLSR